METWYVVERTFDLPRQARRRARIDRPALGPDPDRAGLRSGRDLGGIGGLVGLVAVLSVSIGLINLFPIPLLDGGHLLFYAIEACAAVL